MTTHTTGPVRSFTSRAVLRIVEPGNTAICSSCGEQVKFRAKVRQIQVIANVYDGGIWKRVEHYHAACYDSAGEPYGPADAALR